jgi:hypothetical protein
MKTWEEFNTRFTGVGTNNPLDFFGCVDKDGVWFDSSNWFEVAVHWCCYQAGQLYLSPEKEIQWMTNEGVKLGYSVVHGTMLKQMYEKGLIK